MTVDEMIDWVIKASSFRTLDNLTKQQSPDVSIICALRAGQAMRKRLYSHDPEAQTWDVIVGEAT